MSGSPAHAGRTRFPAPVGSEVSTWNTCWRSHERRLNELPQFVAQIDGVDLHFVHVRSKESAALPLAVTHGWPGSIFEFHKIIGPLTDRTARGGRAEVYQHSQARITFDGNFLGARGAHTKSMLQCSRRHPGEQPP